MAKVKAKADVVKAKAKTGMVRVAWRIDTGKYAINYQPKGGERVTYTFSPLGVFKGTEKVDSIPVELAEVLKADTSLALTIEVKSSETKVLLDETGKAYETKGTYKIAFIEDGEEVEEEATGEPAADATGEAAVV